MLGMQIVRTRGWFAQARACANNNSLPWTSSEGFGVARAPAHPGSPGSLGTEVRGRGARLLAPRRCGAPSPCPRSPARGAR
jgi:hypothetical protein